MSNLEVPAEIAGCRIEATAARGTFVTVYRAVRDGKAVTVLIPAPGVGEEDGYRERFLEAAHLATGLDHANVLDVYDGGEGDGVLYQVTRWVDGVDLRARLASRGALSPAEAMRILRPVARALAAAHRSGLIHGGLGSEAVVLAFGEEGESLHVYLTGFGFGPAPSSESGTADDIAAFGALMLEALTGRAPTDEELAAAREGGGAQSDGKPAPGAAGPLANGLRSIIARAMETDPERRLASGDELVIELEREFAAARATPLAPVDARTGPALPPARAMAQEPAAPASAPARRTDRAHARAGGAWGSHGSRPWWRERC